jgi:transposase-like protein
MNKNPKNEKEFEKEKKWTPKFYCMLKENYGRWKIKTLYVHHFSWKW